MLRTLTLFVAVCFLAGCEQEGATSTPYFNSSFVGYYLTSQDAMPVGMRLELTASGVEQHRYTITGTAKLGTETFTAEGYELSSPNQYYLAPQSSPPPTGNAFIEFKDEAGATSYTLCTEIDYRENGPNPPRVETIILIEGPPDNSEEPAYCLIAYRGYNFAIAELTRQSFY